MADKAICKIEGCGKSARNRGWCSAHYERFRKHGDPLRGGMIGTSPGEPLRYYREVVLAYEGKECLVWPYGCSKGYATLHHEGRKLTVSRLLCEEANGPPPTPEHEAAHSCGKGNQACVTKRHLSWKTPTDNQADRLAHGTHNRGERYGLSKLTEADVKQIRASIGTVSRLEIGRRFGVTEQTVTDIHTGRSWAWLE